MSVLAEGFPGTQNRPALHCRVLEKGRGGWSHWWEQGGGICSDTFPASALPCHLIRAHRVTVWQSLDLKLVPSGLFFGFVPHALDSC